MEWGLPESVEVGGREWAIRSDFRAILDIVSAMGDPALDKEQRALVALTVFYPDLGDMPYADYAEAFGRLRAFVDGPGAHGKTGGQRLMDWEQDFPLIVSPVNRVLGYECREREHVHWWTFLAAYMEIGECLFANVVSTRRKKARGKMDKADRDFYRRNRALVDFRARESEDDAAIVAEWIG